MSETVEAWEAMLLGLAALCQGLGAAYNAGELEPDQAGDLGIVSEDELAQLLQLAGSPATRSAVLSMAATRPGSASSSMQSR